MGGEGVFVTGRSNRDVNAGNDQISRPEMIGAATGTWHHHVPSRFRHGLARGYLALIFQDAIDDVTTGVILHRDAIVDGTNGVNLQRDAVDDGTNGVNLQRDAVDDGTNGVNLQRDAIDDVTTGVFFYRDCLPRSEHWVTGLTRVGGAPRFE